MYIEKTEISTYIQKGKAIEIWFGFGVENEFETCKWLTIEYDSNEDQKYSIVYHEVFNDEDEGVESIYDYSYVEPDDIYGEIIFKSDTLDLVIKELEERYSLNLNNLVLEGNMHQQFELEKNNK